MSEAKKRGRGRPQTIPDGARARAVFLTDAEWDGPVLDAATSQGMSRNEWLRRLVMRSLICIASRKSKREQ